MIEKRRRTLMVLMVATCLLAISAFESMREPTPPFVPTNSTEQSVSVLAVDALDQLPIKGRAPKTGYERSKFGDGWAETNSCDTRNHVLARDLEPEIIDQDGCTVLQGSLRDPYEGDLIEFFRGESTSGQVQIDHVVALSDAWQKGAQELREIDRLKLANDGLNLLAVDGRANQQKGDGDAATWLPSNKAYRCQYIARQIAVKRKYYLWVTRAEADAMRRVLHGCPGQQLPDEAPSK